MRNPFKSIFRPPVQDRDVAVETKAVVDTGPHPYMQRQRIHPSTDLWGVGTQAIKHCLTWRMAVDWNLEQHVPRAQRPADHEYSRFERCCANYGRLLGNHYKSNTLHIMKTHLDQFVFIPGEKLGIGVSKLPMPANSIGSLRVATLFSFATIPEAQYHADQDENRSTRVLHVLRPTSHESPRICQQTQPLRHPAQS